MSQATELIAQQMAAAANVANIWGKIVINVNSFGANGNGLASDTATNTLAIQAAINYAISIGKHEVTFPAGTYYYGVLTNTSGITFIGDGVILIGTTVLTLVSFATIAAGGDTWLKGEIINMIGDSILVVGTTNYPTLVASLLKCTVNNYGISGNMLSGSSGINTRIAGMAAGAKINVVSGGTNDWTWDVTLGTIADTTNATVYGALDVIALALIANFPNSINIFMSPLKRSKPADGGAASYTLQSLCRAMADVAKKYNILFIDNYDNMPNFNPNVATLLTRWAPDGLHPNDAYLTTFFANKVARSLASLESNTKIFLVEGIAPIWNAPQFTAVSGFTCEKDDNRVITFAVIGTLTAPAAAGYIIGNVGLGYRPRMTTILSGIAYSPLAPVVAWIATDGNINVQTNAAFTGTLYLSGCYRVLFG